ANPSSGKPATAAGDQRFQERKVTTAQARLERQMSEFSPGSTLPFALPPSSSHAVGIRKCSQLLPITRHTTMAAMTSPHHTLPFRHVSHRIRPGYNRSTPL